MLNIPLMLSVNLGILNLLPIPALDGGRLVFLLIEVIRGKPIPPGACYVSHKNLLSCRNFYIIFLCLQGERPWIWQGCFVRMKM